MNARHAVSASHRHVLDPPALCQVIFACWLPQRHASASVTPPV